MPNYKLSPTVVDDMKTYAKKLVERRISQMQSGFPLSRDRIQEGILPEKWRQTIKDMAFDNLDTLQKTERVLIVVSADRPTLVQLFNVKPKVFYCYDENIEYEVYAKLRFNKNQSPRITFDMSVLSDSERAALVAWANTAVQERRLANLAMRTVNAFLDKHATSVGHVVARWPGLVMLAKELNTLSNAYTSPTQQKFRKEWRNKFASPPANLKPYRWQRTDEWPVKNQKAMKLTEVMLTSGSMMPEPVAPTALGATLVSWTPLSGDLDKPE